MGNSASTGRSAVAFLTGWALHYVAACAALGAALTPATHPAQSRPSLPPISPQSVLAHGTDDYFWIAQVQPGKDPADPSATIVTRIDYRPPGSEPWKHFSDVQSRVVSMASSGAELAVLCENGDWYLLFENNGGVSGRLLPGGAKLVTLANDRTALYAIGTLTLPAATQPSTTAPARAPATAPTISAAPTPVVRLSLYSFDGNGWRSEGALLPSNIPVDAPMSLAIVDHVSYVAIRREDNTLQILRQSPAPQTSPSTGSGTAAWSQLARLPAPTTASTFKLLSGFSPVSLWVADDASDRLILFQSNGSEKTLSLKAPAAPVANRATAYAINAIREIALVDAKLVEQDYDAQTLQPQGNATPITLPAAPVQPYLSGLFRLAVTIALAFAILSSARRRRDEPEEREGLPSVVLADLGRRLAGGLIDAAPFLAPLSIFLYIYYASQMERTPSPALQWWLIATFMGAFVIYVLHTALTEAFAGRSIGKMIMGLRIVRTDGGTPDRSSLLIRNFLRVIDILLIGVLFIAFSPLRQRMGDVAAGTIVVRDRVKPEPQDSDSPKPEQSPEEPEPPR